MVLQPDAPQILLSGTAHFAHPASDFEAPDGVLLFPNLQITCSISHQVEAKKDENWHGTGEWSTERSRDKMERPASCHSAVEGELYSCTQNRRGEFTNTEARHCLLICRLISSYPFLLLPVLFQSTQFLASLSSPFLILLIPNPLDILPTFPFTESITRCPSWLFSLHSCASSCFPYFLSPPKATQDRVRLGIRKRF